MTATRRERAYHEAGHAVALHHTGRRVDRISIQGTGRIAGFVFSSPAGAPEWTEAEITSHTKAVATGAENMTPAPKREPTAQEIADGVLVALAGVEAQKRNNGSRSCGLPGDDFDMAEARQLLGEGRRSTLDFLADIADARVRTRAFLEEHWSEVEVVACALEGAGTLRGKQFRTLVGAVTAPAVAQTEAPRVVWHEESRATVVRLGLGAATFPVRRFTPTLQVLA